MKKSILLLALLGVIVLMTSCQKAEEVTVSKYFQAITHKDTDTMARMAYVPKLVEYKAFEVLSIDEPVTKPLELSTLTKKLAELTQKHRAQIQIVVEKTDEVADLEYELEETRRSSKKAELRKKIEELKAEIEEETEEVKRLQADVTKTKKEIEREKALITLSTDFKENLEMFSGDTTTNKVTV
jgi:predicted RNase H-like nuclease (RuvC/YqgF family)